MLPKYSITLLPSLQQLIPTNPLWMCQVWVKCLIHTALFLLHSSPPGEVLFSLLTREYTCAYNTLDFLVTPARDLSFPSASPCPMRSYTASHAELTQSKRNDWWLDEWIEPRCPALQADSSPSEPLGKPHYIDTYCQIWNLAMFIKSTHSLPCKAEIYFSISLCLRGLRNSIVAS